MIATELAAVARSARVSPPASTTGTSTVADVRCRRPAVVALGGGHGLAVALRAVRRYAGSITAVVSVADDGGSSGRLRRELGTLPPGDLRKCLVALADERGVGRGLRAPLQSGELAGHALGNLVLVGLAETMGTSAPRSTKPGARSAPSGGSSAGDHRAGRPQGRGRDRAGEAPGRRGPGRGRQQPRDPAGRARARRRAATPESLDAIAAADQVVLAPGSLYTSLLPVVCVQRSGPRCTRFRRWSCRCATSARRYPRPPASTAPTQLAAVLDHGGRVDALPVSARRRGWWSTTTARSPLGCRAGRGAVAGADGSGARSRTIGEGASALCCSRPVDETRGGSAHEFVSASTASGGSAARSTAPCSPAAAAPASSWWR